MSKVALVPDGFTLKKVSKAEEEALKDHRKHEDIKSFLSSDSSGTAIGGGILGLGVIAFFIPMFLQALKALAADPKTQNKTVSQLVLEHEKGEIDSFELYVKAFAGVPETLLNVVVPPPIQSEIEAQTGLDIGSLFGRIRNL